MNNMPSFMSLRIMIILLIVILSQGCQNRTMTEIYTEELIYPGFSGIVESTELWKGGGMKVFLKGQDKYVGISNKYFVLSKIKTSDTFVKKPNSNKCCIIRGDSVYYFDCLNLERLKADDRAKLLAIDQWDRQVINSWRYASDVLHDEAKQ